MDIEIEAASPIGISPSVGFGDRLGLSSPGHILAMRRSGLMGQVLPIFAQQSVRENTRTGRTPAQVMDDAAQAVKSDGWDAAWGADADHLKTFDDVAEMAAAGFTFFTADPSDHVHDEAAEIPDGEADKAFWDLFTGARREEGERLLADYAEAGEHSLPGGATLAISREDAQRAALVYWDAVQNTVSLYGEVQRLWKGAEPFDFEISVDETSAPTTHAAHYIVAAELRRAGVRLTSLAPRFVGSFEKGIDYIGDIGEFEDNLKTHVEIAQAMGPYKLSVHSGSDKFSIYPLLARHCGSLLHLKTAGTSYLEALRIPARHEPSLFRAMAALARSQFAASRATYHLTTDESKAPDPESVADEDLESRFLDAPEANDPRQVLHVAFGDIARDAVMGPAFNDILRQHPEEHAEDIARHMERHLTAFAKL